MKNKILMAGLSCISLLAACNEYDFNQEQYKNEAYIMSNRELIYDRQVAEYSPEGFIVKLPLGLSGSQAASKQVNISVVKDDSLFNAYNKSNFDIDSARFAKLLPEANYEMQSMDAVIPKGSFTADIPIKLKNIETLSPDSVYFLDFKIDEHNSFTFNKKKSHVLMRIHWKNDYTTTQAATFYNYTSTTIVYVNADGSNTVRRPTNANRVFPLGKNKVRLLAGSEDFGDYKKAAPEIAKKSIVLEVKEQTYGNPRAFKLAITPYKGIDVVQLNPIDEYDNTYVLNVITTPDGRSTYYKEFRLHYKYRLAPNEPYKVVKAILRHSYNPRSEQK